MAKTNRHKNGHKREKRARGTKKGQGNALISKRPACIDGSCRGTGISKVDARSILYHCRTTRSAGSRRPRAQIVAERRAIARSLVERNHSGELELTKSYEALFAVIHARAPIDRGHGLAAPSESGLKGDACTTTFVAPPSRDRGRTATSAAGREGRDRRPQCASHPRRHRQDAQAGLSGGRFDPMGPELITLAAAPGAARKVRRSLRQSPKASRSPPTTVARSPSRTVPGTRSIRLFSVDTMLEILTVLGWRNPTACQRRSGQSPGPGRR